MASIDEAYLDLAGTERMHGPPSRPLISFWSKSPQRQVSRAPAD
jgi:nucleotidyltransferase/DNA polymerase involved in DNA repair